MPPKRSLAPKRQTKISFSPTTKPSPKKHARTVSLSSDDDDVIPSRPAKRRKLEDEIEISSGGSQEEEESEGEVHVTSSKKATKRVKPAEESDEETIPVPRTRRSRAKAKQLERVVEEPEPRRSRRAVRRAPAPVVSESEDEEQAPRLSKARTRRHTAEESDEEDKEDITPKRSRPRHGQRSSTPEEVPPKRSQRKPTRQPATPEQESGNEEEGTDSYDEDNELKDELAFLRSSPLPDRGRLRSTHDKPKSEREKALEALKKRRGGTTEPSSSATPNRKKPLVIDSDSESELEVIREVEEVDANTEGEDDIEDGTEEDEEDGDEEHNTNAFAIFQENVEDEDFIDDDDALIGLPAEHTSIPLEYTSLASAKPRELFKYAIEWMVRNSGARNASFSQISGAALLRHCALRHSK